MASSDYDVDDGEGDQDDDADGGSNAGPQRPIKIKPSHKGLLHKKAGVPVGKKIPMSTLEKMKHAKSPSTRKQATFAENARGWNK